jgi:hypothetical protein
VAQRLVGLLGRQADDGSHRVEQLELVGQAFRRPGFLDRRFEQGGQLVQVLVPARLRQLALRVAQDDQHVFADPDDSATDAVVRPEDPGRVRVVHPDQLPGQVGHQIHERVAIRIDLDNSGPAAPAPDAAEVGPGRAGDPPEDQRVGQAEAGRQLGDRLLSAVPVHLCRPR